MEDALKFMKEYSSIYRTERYVSMLVSIITLVFILSFFGYQLFSNRDADIEIWSDILNAVAGIGSTGILSIAIGYIFKFMDKAKEAALDFINNQNNSQNGN